MNEVTQTLTCPKCGSEMRTQSSPKREQHGERPRKSRKRSFLEGLLEGGE
jgi:hypothetical protein